MHAADTDSTDVRARDALAHIEIGPDDIQEDPFPHAVVENALPQDVADALRDHFPDPSKFARFRPTLSNQKLSRSAWRLLRSSGLCPAWRDILEDMPDFATRCFELFAPSILAEHPGIEERFGRLAQLRREVAKEDGAAAPGAYSIDSRLNAHTPVRHEARAERPPHIKNLHSVLYSYLDLVRDDDDAGGDYVLYRPRTGARIVCEGRRQGVSHDLLDAVKTIPRRHNSLVVFVNGPRSIQWISPRQPTTLPLLSHHLTLHLSEPVFSLAFAPGAEPTSYGSGLSPRRTLRVLRQLVTDWVRRSAGPAA